MDGFCWIIWNAGKCLAGSLEFIPIFLQVKSKQKTASLSLPMHNKNTVTSIISNISTLARLLQRHYSVFHIAEYLQLLEQVYQHP